MKDAIISKLFTPIELGDITLKNRIVMAPMTRSRAIGHLPNALIAEYYRQRAGAGLIITEGVAPSPDGIGYSRTPGIYSEQQIAAWSTVTDALHQEGGRIFMQLMHVGRMSHTLNAPAGSRIVAPSTKAAQGSMWTDQQGMLPYGQPEALTEAEVKETVAAFAQAASNAIRAGFDGVELHGANGYLPEQFLNPHVNDRADRYGGSVENRTRFMIEVASAISQAIGSKKLGVRLSPYNTYNDMALYPEIEETYRSVVTALEDFDIAYVHLVEASVRNENPALIQALRASYSGRFIVNGGYTRSRAEEVIDSARADLVSFGSAFIGNPDLPHRLGHDLPLREADPSLFFAAGAEGFTDYAAAEA